MLAGDAIALVMTAVFGGWIAVMALRERGRRLDTVVMKSKAGLVIAGLVFGAIAAAMFIYGVSELVQSPGELIDTHRFGAVHGWALGIAAIVVSAIVAYPAALLLGKAVQTAKNPPADQVSVVEVASRGTARFEPKAAPLRAADLPAARAAAIAALDRATTLDEVSAAALAFLRDGYGAPPSGASDALVAFARERELRAEAWGEVLERLDAARYGGVDATLAEMAARVRELVAG